MAIFKRGRTYWFHFHFGGRHVQRSTKQGNPNVARTIAAAYRTALAKGEVGILERKPVPTLTQFRPQFLNEIKAKCAASPATIQFYESKLKLLLGYDRLAGAHLDAIDEQLIASYIQSKVAKLKPATINRSLATLRRLLRLAQEWRIVNRVPRIRLLPGEGVRDFVLSRALQPTYLLACPEPLRSVAKFSLETGLRIGETLALQWADVHFDSLGGARRGYVRVRKGKSQNAKRNVSLTAPAREVLLRQRQLSKSELVFVKADGVSLGSRSTIDHQHQRVRKELGLPADFVVHSFRHTALTRLGEAGAEAFTIMKIAGHSTITVSQRYVHPTPETLERAFDRLEALNRSVERKQRQAPATVSATLESEPVTVVQ